MAEFYPRPGSPGKFVRPTYATGDPHAGENSLTIPVGQTAEIILWGTGPGATALKVDTGESTISHFSYSPDVQRYERLGLGEWERLFRLTPRAAGDVRLHAKTYDGQEYAAPIRLVAIDARAEAKSPTAVVLCDNATYYMAIRRPQTTIKVDVAGLGRYLRQCRDTGVRLNYLEFYTHGWPGYIWLDKDTIGAQSFLRLKGQGFDRVFSPGATILLNGCWCGRGAEGNELVLAIGDVLLCGGGGRVMAAIDKGRLHALDPTGTVRHDDGCLKWAEYSPGGTLLRTVNFDDSTCQAPEPKIDD